ncbi:hypothetical protein [Ralstonia soli]|uniref:Uncharacterized protein n=1 Tax=Ralstonia soli TaxID=2953896 RepID=A0ABT1ANB4_9RALS|nr:hypothetical protein [Ralstonia soli]MCO5399597.1 hypothetical protein [Ralstonia soli]
MRDPAQTAAPSPHTSAPADMPSDTARLLANTVPLEMECCGRRIEATYSARNDIVTVKYRDKTLSTYSPQGDHKAVARQLLCVMLTI